MPWWRRFKGAILTGLALAIVATVLNVIQRREEAALRSPEALKPVIYRFEKDDMMAVRIERPDGVLDMRKVDGEWEMAGVPWRPARSMTRRVAHQLHDLTARAEIVDPNPDRSVYGLGEQAIRVGIALRDGSTLNFVVGDPNPTGVSYYVMPEPGDRVFVVKKSAMDFYRLDLESFRENRFATFDSEDATTVRATVDGRTIAVERTGELTWRMTEPVVMDASRQEARTMLGRVAALTAAAFVEDHPADKARYGLDPAAHRIEVRLATGATFTLEMGSEIPDTDPPQSYAYCVEDDAVYVVRNGLLDAYRKPIDDYRNEVVFPGRHEWNLASMTVWKGSSDALTLRRTSDGWRWPDDQAVPGQTPKRVAGSAADLRVVAWPTDVTASGLDVPAAIVELAFEDGAVERIELGHTVSESHAEGRDEVRQYVRVGGKPDVFLVGGTLGDVIDDLFREFGRKEERQAERRLDLAP